MPVQIKLFGLSDGAELRFNFGFSGLCFGFKLGTAPLSNSWIIIIIWLYIALKRTPNIDCYWVGGLQAWG